MIRSVEMVHPLSVDLRARGAAVAVIMIATPGGTIVAPARRRTLHLIFDTLAGELEAAALRVAQAAPAVPFTIDHARTLAAFLSPVQDDPEPIALLVHESEGYVRSVTVARWAARRLGCPLHEPAQAAAVASCVLMDSVLSRLPPPSREVARRVPQAARWAVQS